MDDLRHDYRCRADARSGRRAETDLRPDPSTHPAAGRRLFRAARRHCKHLPRTNGGYWHRRGVAGNHSGQQGDAYSLSLLDLACADGAAGEHGPDELMDLVDDRAHQGQSWTILAHRPALRLPDGRGQFLDLLPDAGLAAVKKDSQAMNEPPASASVYRIGIDVGGTFTKAVLIDNASHE